MQLLSRNMWAWILILLIEGVIYGWTYLGTEGGHAPFPPPPNVHKKPFSIQKFFRPPLIKLHSSKFYSFCFVFFFLLLCPFLCLFNRSGLVHLIFISCFIRLAHMTVINDESNFYNPSHVTVLIPPPSGHMLSF